MSVLSTCNYVISWNTVKGLGTSLKSRNAHCNNGTKFAILEGFSFMRGHSRPQRPRFFWSAPGIETSGRLQNRKSTIHGLTERVLCACSKIEWPELSIPGAD